MSSHPPLSLPTAMVSATPAHQLTLNFPPHSNTKLRHERFEGDPINQHVLITSSSAPPSPALHSFRYISQQAPYSPPFTPPNFTSSTFYEHNNRSFPFTPSTPTFSPVPGHDDGSQFIFPLSRNVNDELSYSRIVLDPCAQPFVPARGQVPPKHMHRLPFARRIPQPPALSTPRNRPRLFYRAKADRVLVAAVNACDAHLYSSRFPAGHVLHRDFVRRYAPGAQIGVGAFGFVVTGRDRLLGHEVAVKFIEKSKVPSWGWSNDPELGRVPTEAVLLKLLDHPGIIKFLDLFQDRIYFYLVEELHGSPWRGKQPTHTLKEPNTPSAFEEPASTRSAEQGLASLSQPLGAVHQATLDSSRSAPQGSVCPMPPYPRSSSSSLFLSPPCSPVSPVSPLTPLTPPHEARPNMGRRQSHDLFECIEEYQRLSESQARYIFAQVVDVIGYLDSIGVTHRDIKDENVLIDRAFRVKLIDFGAASCVDPRAPRPWYRHFRGTIAYAPAEIIREVECHQAEPADIWALGILLSYLITGKSAFPTAADASNGRITLHNCTVRGENKPRVPLRQEHTISAECWNLLTRCLDPNPQTRATIAEVKSHPWLEHALDKV